jgi:ubiquinone/menaquinone biosynthesis C-methylase UbiE
MQGHVIGIDFSATMVRETAKELAQLGIAPNAAVQQMDAEQLQFPDASFDYVLCGFAIFFFPQLDRALAEFRRVLKPNGRMGVTTWDKVWDEQWHWFNAIVTAYLPPEVAASQATAADAHPRPVFDTPAGLTAIMNAAGFADIQVSSETAEFIYASKEEFWSTLWSHGLRGTLERIEQTTGSAGLQRFKAEVFKQAEAIQQTDGLQQLVPVLFALATKPRRRYFNT